MKTEELEAKLRDVLRERAERITETDVASNAATGEFAALRPRAARGRSWSRTLTAAAVLLVVVGLVAAGLMGRDEQPIAERVEQEQAAQQPVTGSVTAPRAWPLTSDEPLPAGIPPEKLQTPEAATQAYLGEIGLPSAWPISEMQTTENSAVAKYVLQDVPAEVHLTKTTEGFWYVTYASTEFIASARPTGGTTGFDLSIAPGPRMYEGGARVVATVLAADGRVLSNAETRVEPQKEGQAGAAAVVALQWDGQEMAAVIRADVKDDHDGNPSTPDATIGHWTTALPALSGGPQGMPAAVDYQTGEPVFRAPGSVDEVAESYLRDRFPDYPAPGVELEPAFTRGRDAVVTWSTGDSGGTLASGSLWLRRFDEAWAVMAAMTNDVDISALEVGEGRVRGRVTTENINSLFADVFQPDGTPAAGSPRPEGQPNAAYRFGTAGGPGRGSLDIDVPVEPGSAVVRVNLVGGTILSISEVRLVVR